MQAASQNKPMSIWWILGALAALSYLMFADDRSDDGYGWLFFLLVCIGPQAARSLGKSFEEGRREAR